LTPLSHLLPPLPGFALPRTYAPFPVWSGSTIAPARFLALPKKQVIRLWHRAREFDRQTHQAGRHGGAVGRTALAVLHSLVFDFLNHRTGRLDPSYAAIARKSGVSLRAVSDALKRLRELGLLHRIRRCVEDWQDGQFRLRQETNAYMLLPESYWRGWRPPAEPPAPASGTWGDPAPVLTGVALAALESNPVLKVAALRTELGSDLARALASLGASILSRRDS
jgi:hypothetical protein